MEGHVRRGGKRGRVAALIGALTLVAIALFWGAGDFTTACETIVRRSVVGPDGKKAAVIFERECGATVGFNTQVSLAPVKEPFSDTTSPAFLVLSGRHDIVLRWLGEKSIEIEIPEEDDVIRSEPRVGGTIIAYRIEM